MGMGLGVEVGIGLGLGLVIGAEVGAEVGMGSVMEVIIGRKKMLSWTRFLFRLYHRHRLGWVGHRTE